jgi:hypothetical protein
MIMSIYCTPQMWSPYSNKHYNCQVSIKMGRTTNDKQHISIHMSDPRMLPYMQAKLSLPCIRKLTCQTFPKLITINTYDNLRNMSDLYHVDWHKHVWQHAFICQKYPTSIGISMYDNKHVDIKFSAHYVFLE